MPQPRRKAIGIKRVSLLKQVGNYSFDGQGNKFAILSERFDCDIPADLMIEDKGYSGTDFNRPSIKQALRMIRAGEANAVAFPWVDRFARDVEGGLATIRMFLEAGAGVLLGDLGWYRDEGSFRFQMNIHLSVAQYQRDDIAEKSRWGVQAKLAMGRAHYGAPYGWHMVTGREIAARAMRDGQQLPTGRPANFYERVLEDLEVVQLMGELALAGGRDGSARGICRELEARGIKAPRSKTGRWNPTTVTNILRDEVYSTGIWHYGKREFVKPEKFRKLDIERHRVRSSPRLRAREQWADNTVEMPGGAIWTPDEHEAVKEALERNGRTSTGKPTGEGGTQAVLSSLCKCGGHLLEGGEECGGAIAPWHKVKRSGERQLYYRCTRRDRVYGNHLCDARSIHGEILEEAVWQGVREAVCEKLDELIRASVGEMMGGEDADEVARLEQQEKRLTAKKQEAQRAEIAADDPEDKKLYAGMVADYKAQLALLRRRIQTATDEADAAQVDTATIQRKARKAFQTKDPAERRAHLLDWLQEVRYADGWAELTIRVRVGANCQHAVGDVGAGDQQNQPDRALQQDQASADPGDQEFL
jgi:DNA invertase Pin-like site-specific DNA recombinase